MVKTRPVLKAELHSADLDRLHLPWRPRQGEWQKYDHPIVFWISMEKRSRVVNFSTEEDLSYGYDAQWAIRQTTLLSALRRIDPLLLGSVQIDQDKSGFSDRGMFKATSNPEQVEFRASCGHIERIYRKDIPALIQTITELPVSTNWEKIKDIS